ncbi:hypothetical protein [Vibrio rarus]|uniref:hypothetical protein n=1 Tax=Vibrio rarus TaxID=413403 RepID=UPI0021C42A9D|nr:hypothetical protein [Vibrio rarus]
MLKPYNETGQTLLEVLMSLGISSVLLLSTSTLLVHQQQLLSKLIEQAQLFIESQYLSNYLRGEIRRSGYAQSSSLYTQASQLGIGYKDDVEGYRRVFIWRDATQAKLKYCRDASIELAPIADTCAGNINYSMLNDKLFSMSEFIIATHPAIHGVLRVDYALAIKGAQPQQQGVYSASRNSLLSLSDEEDANEAP